MVDADLDALQEVRDCVRAAREAQDALAGLDQEKTDAICRAIALAVEKAAPELARQAVQETGMGTVEGKTAKTVFGSRDVWASIRDRRTVGIISRDDEQGLWEVAVPMGVVAAVVPTTNPTSTAIYKILISAKARNAIVLSPHPRARRCIAETCRIARDAGRAAGAPEGFLQCLSNPTLESTQALMGHAGIGVILATGGAALVEAAYSSGKPAYGVGPGNVPVWVDRSADLRHAARCIVDSMQFDYGTICASEQAVVIDAPQERRFLEEMVERGAFICDADQVAALEQLCNRRGMMNPEVVGQSPATIARMAGFSVPADATVLLCPQGGVGRDWPLSIEILAPILATYVEDGWEAGCERCIETLRYGGVGHTLVLHATDSEVIEAFALEKPANRILINAPASQGAVGYATNLRPSMTLGCGTMGGNITPDNISVEHLVNVKRVAFLRSDWYERSPSHGPASGAEATSSMGGTPAFSTGYLTPAGAGAGWQGNQVRTLSGQEPKTDVAERDVVAQRGQPGTGTMTLQ